MNACGDLHVLGWITIPTRMNIRMCFREYIVVITCLLCLMNELRSHSEKMLLLFIWCR